MRPGCTTNTFRFYDPDIGRFINPDPIGLSGGVNLYQYAPNSVTWIDPLGLSCDLTEHRKDHILNRHRYGAGKPGKTEFPSHWSDSDILQHVSDVATDPHSVAGVGKWNSPYVVGVRDGIEIRVDFYPATHPPYAGKISTAYPINVSPNPP
ncbi:RHS repeat-associated core domain-containing protein [Burkholderia ambifaria]|uniref:RHS repeat-associated core domain-containing protein n=1 Tax=Burkholderia ambifaria TaxID=152480 RepID=UPI001FC7F831|nr:RHS repeat-associated core domain-containing protein [Burkholderia ambifaria]